MCASESVLLRIESDDEPENVDTIGRGLVRQLRQSGLIEDVRSASETAPARSKSYEALTIGAFVLAVAPTVIPELLALLKDWIDRRSHKEKVIVEVKRGDGSTHIEYRPGDMSMAEIGSLIETLSSTSESG